MCMGGAMQSIFRVARNGLKIRSTGSLPGRGMNRFFVSPFCSAANYNEDSFADPPGGLPKETVQPNHRALGTYQGPPTGV
jgi:hypothetical protein